MSNGKSQMPKWIGTELRRSEKGQGLHKDGKGFTLIELAVVLVIVGIVVSIVTSVLPSLLRSAKIKESRAILEKVDYSMEGYMSANGRFPYADADGDGIGDNGVFFGDLPFRDLGLSSGDDAWRNRIKYGVYDTLTTSSLSDFCDVLKAAATSSFTPSRLHINQSGVRTNMAYVIVSGGARDLDGVNGFFDRKNGDDDAEFDDPERLLTNTYDDLMLARSFNEVAGIQRCAGGSE